MKIIDTEIDMAGKFRARVDISAEVNLVDKTAPATILLKFQKPPKSDQLILDQAQVFIDSWPTKDQEEDKQIEELDKLIQDCIDKKDALNSVEEKL